MPGEYRAIWSVPGAGTGYSVFHTGSAVDSELAQDIADAIRAFFAGIVGQLPNDVTVSFDSELLILNAAGVLEAVQPVTAPAAIAGGASGGWAGGVGMRVDWGTGEIVAGRRFVGRTYLVPLASAVFEADGTPGSGTITAIASAAGTLVSTLGATLAPLSVWSRVHGVTHEVTTVSVPNKSAIMRSRRD